MLALHSTKRFEKDYRLMIKRGYDIARLKEIVLTLRIPEKLPPKNHDHELSGNLAGFRECHIQNDWLLMYKQTETDLYLARTGTHSDLF